MLDGTLVDPGVQPQRGRQVEQTLLLAADGGAAGPGRHEQRLDAERVPCAEQLEIAGVPQRESEHAAQPAQRLGAPVVVGGQDRLAVAVGGEDSAVLLGEFGTQLEVVVDLAVEYQHVTVRILRRAPPQGLVRMRDVDDREPVETEHHLFIGPGAGFVGASVAHQGRCAGHRVDRLSGDAACRIRNQGKQSAHAAKYAARHRPAVAAASRLDDGIGGVSG